MSNENNNDESIISVRTPWGNLVKAQSVQSILDALKEDLVSYNRRLRDLERTKTPLPTLELPGEIQKKVPSSNIEELKAEINALSSRVNGLFANKATIPNIQSVESATKSIAQNLDSLKSDIFVMNRKLLELEKAKQQIVTPAVNNVDPTVTKALAAFDKRIVMVENKMRDLEAKFERFSAKTIQILEQLRK